MTLSTIVLIFAVLFLVIILLERLAADYQGLRVAFKNFGPRTDTRYMTRAELFKSARVFLYGGLVLVVVWIAIGYLINHFAGREALEHPVVQVFIFGISLLIAFGFIGALWLGMRGLIRRADYDPVQVFQRDMATRD